MPRKPRQHQRRGMLLYRGDQIARTSDLRIVPHDIRGQVPVRTRFIQPVAPAEVRSLDSSASTHLTPVVDTNAKWPSTLQTSGRTVDGNSRPPPVTTPLLEDGRISATTSPVVAFNMLPLWRRTSAFQDWGEQLSTPSVGLTRWQCGGRESRTALQCCPGRSC